MNVIESLNYFIARVGGDMERFGLSSNKRGDLWTLKQGVYRLDVFIHVSVGFSSGNNSNFHINFNIYKNDLSKYAATVENRWRKLNSMPLLDFKLVLFSITDWQSLYEAAGIVDKGIWFASLKEMVANKNLENHFNEMLGLAFDFYEKIQDFDFCMEQLKNEGMMRDGINYLAMASSISTDYLNLKYDELKESNSNKRSWNEAHMKELLRMIESDGFKSNVH